MISIIVPVLNEAACIRPLLEALKALEGEKEIIVTDGGSIDGTVELAQSVAGVTVVLSEPGRGQQLRRGWPPLPGRCSGSSTRTPSSRRKP